MRQIYKMLAAGSILLSMCMYTAEGQTRNDVTEAMKNVLGSDDFKGASVSMLAVTGDGDTLLCHDRGRLLIPASNMKLVSTALAMHSLGPDYRYGTGIGYSGTIEEGTLRGDLYIIGGGDPTIGSDNPIATPLDTLFWEWMGMISDTGISHIEGNIVGDGRFFSGMDGHPTWEVCDAGTYYGTGTSGLSFYENVQDFNVSAGEKPGDPVNIEPGYPETPWMEFIYSCTTGKPGTGNSLYFYPDSFYPCGEMRGSFAVDRQPRTEHAANRFPEYTLAWYFWRFLADNGIESEEGPADTGPVFGICAMPQDSLKIIGRTFSAPLSDIIAETNRKSNNLYAETLMKTLGKEYCGSGCYDSSYVAVRGLLEETGVTGHKTIIRDGSGLSRENLLSADFLCDLLMKMTLSPSFEDFFNSLPRPGGIGTLEYEMQSVPFSIKDRIRMKSGSMGGVRCLSGYIIPETGAREDMIIFSLLVNGYTVPLYRIQRALDSIILSLAAYCPQP